MLKKALLVAVCVLFSANMVFAVQYQITNLDAAVGGGVYVFPDKIMNDGRVVCEYSQPTPVVIPRDFGTSGALVSADGTYTFLGNPWGASNEKMWNPQEASSNSSYVVGSTGDSLGMYWHNGVIKAAPAINPAYPHTNFKGVNSIGYAVGSGQYSEVYMGYGWEAQMHAVIYDGQVIVDLNSSLGNPDRSFATDINDQSLIVGDVYKNGVWSSYSYGLNTGIYTTLPALNGATSGGVRAVNNAGQIVGWSGDSTVLWQNNQIINLGGLAGDAYNNAWDINSSGVVVGDSYNETLNDTRAMMWTVDAGMYYLDSLVENWNGSLFSAHGINDRGQIVATGWDSEGMPHGYLLTPVPEPSTLVLSAIFATMVMLAFCKPTHICGAILHRKK